MKSPHKVTVLLAAPVLLLVLCAPYDAAAIPVDQKERTEQPKKAVPVEYVCPMHSDVTSKERGTCPKCKMALVKRKNNKGTSTTSVAARNVTKHKH